MRFTKKDVVYDPEKEYDSLTGIMSFNAFKIT